MSFWTGAAHQPRSFFLFGQGNIEFACLPYNELPRNAVPVYTAASLCGRPDTNTVRDWLKPMEHSFIRGRGAMKSYYPSIPGQTFRRRVCTEREERAVRLHEHAHVQHDHQVARTAALIGGTCRIHEWPVCCGFLTKNPQYTGHYDICRNTGGNQPCTLPPCALRYPKFIISLL